MDRSLGELVALISTHVSTITKFLDVNSLPHPSFAVNAPAGLPGDANVQRARFALIEAATDLIHLATGPEDYIKLQSLELHKDQFVLEALNHYNVFDAVPLETSISYTDLALKTKLSEARLRRILRHAMTNRMFYEPSSNQIAHTATSAVVVKKPLLKALIGHCIEEVGAASVKLVESMDKYGDSQDPGQAAICLAFGLKEGGNCFTLFEEDGEGDMKGWRARRFGEAMRSLTSGGMYSTKHVHGGFDWQSLGNSTVVDVGGSTGHVSIELATHNPQLSFIIQDFETLRPQFDAIVPEALKPRLQFQAHDFFTPQPVKGASVYFLKTILHDWPDHLCVKIIQNIVSAMKSESRIIVMDGVMPEPGTVPIPIVKLNTSMDLQMMTALNAKERTRKDWEGLFRLADKRLQIVAFRQPEGGMASMIEVVFHDIQK